MPKNIKKGSTKSKPSPGRNVFLALTLVPFVLGLILVGAWVLDIEILDSLQSQITVGVFFFLLSFTASNAVQKRWNLTAGWGILAVADLIVLAWLNVWAQAIASVVGLVGIVVLGIEFYKQYRLNKVENTSIKR